MSLSPSAVLPDVGHYQLLGKIAEGGMGSVYLGQHRDGGPVVAIKVLPPETARNQLLMKRFEQEFRAATLIDHPNVVKAIEYCGTGTHPFLVMEYVSGCSLGEKIEKDGPLGEAEAIHIIRQVCEGLHCAHKQGLIHRDVKPDNILITKDLTAKLTDLGLVRDIESDDNLTRTGRGLGTPHFMAPEQFRNAKYVDVRSDVYAMGATLYMALTGKVPFDKCSPLDCWVKKSKEDFPTPKAIKPNLSDRLDFAVRRAMKANPAERPTSCREFMEDVLGEAWKGRTANSPSGRIVLGPATDLWYMVYYDGGIAHTVKGSTETIRQGIHAGTLGDLAAVLVSRSKAGPFAPLKTVPEFRDLVLSGLEPSQNLNRPLPRSRPIPAPSPRDRHDTPTPDRTSDPIVAMDPADPDTVRSREATDVVRNLPLTRHSTLHLDTDERPRLRPTLSEDRVDRPTRRIPWLIIAGMTITLLIGLFLGRMF